jgi:hypothetical protein
MTKTKAQLNQDTADFLDALDLSERARKQIESTDFYSLNDIFGEMKTAEEVELFIAENYGEEEEE